MQVAAIARARPVDIDRAWEALKDAADPRLHVFISTSDIHLRYQLKKTRAEVLKEAVEAVRRARAYTANVEFSATDATRTERASWWRCWSKPLRRALGQSISRIR